MQVQCIPVRAEEGAVIEALSAFATEIVREHFDPIIGKAQNDYMLARSQSASGIREQIEGGARYYIAADQDGKWLGFTAFYPRGNEMYLSKFYVHKSQRGKGVARCMLELMIHAAKEEGLEKISLNVNRHNDLAIGAYEKMGFVFARAEQIDIGQGFVMDDFVYEYRL